MHQKILSGPDAWTINLGNTDLKTFITMVKDSLFASKIISYAQGLSLISIVGKHQNWDLNLSGIAKIWKGVAL